jgi:hypothetical protein
MKALKLTVLSWLAVSVAMAAGKQPEFVTQEATGEAAIVGGDSQKAYKDARDIALREAVEQVVGVRLSAQTLAANNQLITDKILSRSDGYVRKVEILERKEEGGVAKVTIRAEVGTGALDKDLQAIQALVQQLNNRKLVILLQEQTLTSQGDAINSQTMSVVLTDAFKQDGWTIIDPAFSAGKIHLQPGATKLSNAEAKEIGDLTKADYILYGSVIYRQQTLSNAVVTKEGKQLVFPLTGEYNLTVFETDSGDQLSNVAGKFNSHKEDLGEEGTPLISYERTASDIARARGPQIVAEVRAPVVEYLRNTLFNGNRVVMNVVGLADYAAVQGFKRVLAKELSSGLREMGQGSFDEGKAKFDMVFLGTTDDMAEAVSGKSFKGKKVSVTGVSGNTIELTLAR